MGKQFSKDIEKLQLELEYRNYSLSSVKSYCTTMSAMEKRLNKAVFLPMLEGLNALEVVSFTLNKDMTACKKCKKGRMRAKHKIIASPT